MNRRILALLLIFALLLAPAAGASQALGWELYQTDTVLGDGLTVSAQTLWGDSKRDYRVERYATYTPGWGVTPAVCYGATVPTTATLTRMAKDLEGYGQRVLAGANGDYFVMSSGVPLGMVVTYGTLRTSSSYHYAVGFRADGSAFVGKPDLTISAGFHGVELTVAGGYNKTRESTGGYYLFSPDFGSATKGSGQGINVVLRPVTVPKGYQAPEKPADFTEPEPMEPAADPLDDEGGDPLDLAADDPELTEPTEPSEHELWEEAWQEWKERKDAWEREMAAWRWELEQTTANFETLPAELKIGGASLGCVVESVTTQSGGRDIPPGRFVLTIHKNGNKYLVDELASLERGELVTLSVSAADSRWSQTASALGAYAMILENGVVASGLEQTAGPRTALGIKPDGTVILYTVDGRQSGYSVGASVEQVAKRLLELGCVDAVLFDGGGSTTFGTTGAVDSGFSLDNKPSEGGQRAVTNALFFLSELKPTGKLGSVYLTPQSALMLSGARQRLSGQGVDTGYYPMPGGSALTDLRYTVDGFGRMEGDVFVAGSERGIATVTAATESGAKGTARMTVIATPDAITLTDAAGKPVTALNLDPGQSASLNAAATWYKLPLLADDSCFTWSLTDTVGTVDEYGNLTAGAKAGSGALQVTAGEKTVSIPVTVGGHVKTLETFEDSLTSFDSPDAAVTLDAATVRYGHQSLRVDYPAGGARLYCDLAVDGGESWLGCWAWSDGTPLKLEVALLLADGDHERVTLAEDGWEGWRQLLAPIPENTCALTGMSVTAQDDGALYLDHFITANGPLTDTTAPTVKLSIKDGAVTAALSDNVDRIFYAENLALTLDGHPVSFQLSGKTLTTQLALGDGLFHRLSLEASDASGNLTRAGVDIPGTLERTPPFTDIDGHWAQGYITYLYDQGVTNGRAVGEGLIFDPQTNITRGEFATMLCRWLRLDTSNQPAGDLPFVDADTIPSWALGSVARLYEMGVMNGSLEYGGLYANANAPITRSQAMTMLGRIQPRGFALAAALFSDHEEIPTWAEDYVYTLAGQGVVSGYGGYVRPLEPITRGEVAKLLSVLW